MTSTAANEAEVVQEQIFPLFKMLAQYMGCMDIHIMTVMASASMGSIVFATPRYEAHV